MNKLFSLIPLCPQRCEESCLGCSGPGKTCTKCKEGYNLVGRTCIINASCNNGEFLFYVENLPHHSFDAFVDFLNSQTPVLSSDDELLI